MIDPARAPRAEFENPSLRVQRRDLGHGIHVVALGGEIDLATAPALKASLAQLPAHARVVVDLSAVRHMDSTGLGVLIGFRRRLPDPDRLVLAGAGPVVRALLELTGLDFQLSDVAEDAVASLKQAAVGERQPSLTPDGAMVVGLASTAILFADSPVGEAERWLRVLRLQGEAGRALTALGLSEAPLADAAPPPAARPSAASRDPITEVVEHAKRVAADRASATVGTVDLLRGVMAAYGEDFAWVLRARGSDPDEVMEQLDAAAVSRG